MRYPLVFPAQGKPSDKLANKIQTADFLRNRGNPERPAPPRDVFVQSAPRGVYITWKLPDAQPIKVAQICGWRLYKGDENTLFTELRDRGTRSHVIESSAGTPTSTTFNFFVSSVNIFGRESEKIQEQGRALAETGAPAMPGTPPGYTSESSGGADRSSRIGDRTRIGVQG